MKHEIFSANEWLYPDSIVNDSGKKLIDLASARGSYATCQILLNNIPTGALQWKIISNNSEEFFNSPEVYQLIGVNVSKNTGPEGFTVVLGESAEGYTTRKAPFHVYDAMKPLTNHSTKDMEMPRHGWKGPTEGLYICWEIPSDARIGKYEGLLHLTAGDETCHIHVSIEVHKATVPEQGSFLSVNWFILMNMAKSHGLEMWSEEHWSMIEKYGRMMRRGRQTHFWVTKEILDVEQREDGTYQFGFDKAKRLIEMYLGLGFTHIEGGMAIERLSWDSPEFIIRINDGWIKAMSPEGYSYLAQYFSEWHGFLKENGWLNILHQHVADEPTDKCAEDYRVLSGIIRKFMPGVKLIDAVELHGLDGSVDIWIPKNHYYEQNQEQFERLRKLGDEIWFYTCCHPGGYYMNRCLDMALIRTRYLHWGNYKYNLTGYLHWGFNYYDPENDQFEEITPVLESLNVKSLPPGDTHICYPGTEGPWGSVRLEAMRAGIEDYELLRILESKDKKLADEILSSCVTSFKEYNEDTEHFEKVHRRLLQAVSDIQE